MPKPPISPPPSPCPQRDATRCPGITGAPWSPVGKRDPDTVAGSTWPAAPEPDRGTTPGACGWDPADTSAMFGDRPHRSGEVACMPLALCPLASCPCCGSAARGLVHLRGMKGIWGGLGAALTVGKLRALEAPLVCMPRCQGDGHPSNSSCPCSPCTLGQHPDSHSPHPSIHPSIYPSLLLGRPKPCQNPESGSPTHCLPSQ